MATAPTLFALFSNPNAKDHGALIREWQRELMKVPCPFPATSADREDAASWVTLLLLRRRGEQLAHVAPAAQDFYTAKMFRNRLIGAWKTVARHEAPLEEEFDGERVVLDVADTGPSAEVELGHREIDERFEQLLRAFIAGQPTLLETLRTLLHLRATGMTARGLLGARPDFVRQRNALQKRFERLRLRLLQFIADQADDGSLGDEDAELFTAQVATLRLK